MEISPLSSICRPLSFSSFVSCLQAVRRGLVKALSQPDEEQARREARGKKSMELPTAEERLLFSLPSVLPPPAPRCWCCCARERKGALSVPLLLVMERTLQLPPVSNTHTERNEEKKENRNLWSSSSAPASKRRPSPASLYFFSPFSFVARESPYLSPYLSRSLSSFTRERNRVGLARACR